MVSNYEKIISDIAKLVHEDFLKIYKEKNGGTRVKETKDRLWIKKYKTNKADLAKLNYSDFPSDLKNERAMGSRVALDLIVKRIKLGKNINADFIEYVSGKVHDDWLGRNREKAEEEHKLPYTQLSEETKEKDRIFVRAALKIINEYKFKL